MENESKLINLESRDSDDVVKTILNIFNPTNGMKRIVGIDRDGNKAGVYACRMQESTTKNTYIAIIIKYLNGSYSPTFRIKITDLKLKCEDVKYIQKAAIIKEMENYSLCELEVSYNEVFYTLCSVYSKLPVKTFTKKIPIPQVYSMIRNKAISNEKDKSNDYSVKDGSYNLTSDEIKEIAEEAGYTLEELMDEMVSYEILIKDSDTKRYQRTIRSKMLGVKKFYSFKTPDVYMERTKKSEKADDLSEDEVKEIKKGYKALREKKFSKNITYPY